MGIAPPRWRRVDLRTDRPWPLTWYGLGAVRRRHPARADRGGAGALGRSAVSSTTLHVLASVGGPDSPCSPVTLERPAARPSCSTPRHVGGVACSPRDRATVRPPSPAAHREQPRQVPVASPRIPAAAPTPLREGVGGFCRICGCRLSSAQRTDDDLAGAVGLNFVVRACVHLLAPPCRKAKHLPPKMACLPSCLVHRKALSTWEVLMQAGGIHYE